MTDNTERQLKIKALFDKCFPWALKEFAHIPDADIFSTVSFEVNDLADFLDDEDIIETAKENIEREIKRPLTRYVCEVGDGDEGDMAWEWITNKKKKTTACGPQGYLHAVLYDNLERKVGNDYPINSFDKVEEWYEPNVTLDIYKILKREYKADIKGIGKKKLITAIKVAIDSHIMKVDTVDQLVDVVISDVRK